MTDVTRMRQGRPALNDVPGQLRQMADEIESGDMDAEYVVVVLPRSDTDPLQQDDWPRIFGWGAVPSTLGMIGLMELAKGFFVSCASRRTT